MRSSTLLPLISTDRYTKEVILKNIVVVCMFSLLPVLRLFASKQWWVIQGTREKRRKSKSTGCAFSRPSFLFFFFLLLSLFLPTSPRLPLTTNMNPLKKLFSRTAKAQHPRPRTVQPLPLEIAEILAQIFNYLNDSTLRRTVALVCRQWFLINQGRFLRNVVWDNTWTEPRLGMVPSSLVGAARFHCCLLVKRTNGLKAITYEETVNHLLSECQDEYKKQAEQQRQRQSRVTPKDKPWTSLYRLSPLQALHLEVNTIYDISNIEAYIPPISTLTSLVLTCRHANTFASNTTSINLALVLQNCPALEYFEAQGSFSLELRWAPLLASDQQHPFNLRSLVLDSTGFYQQYLHRLLSLAPRLKVLKLIAVPTHSFSYPGYHWAGLFAHLRLLPIALDTVFCSSRDQFSPPLFHRQLLEICPVVSEWNLWALDVSPLLLQELEAHTNNLTSLVLYSKPHRTGGTCCLSELKHAPTTLHRFLSTPDTLVHLRTLKTVALLVNFDIHGRGGYVYKDDPNRDLYMPFRNEAPKPLEVWRCHNLLTLHLEIHAPGEHMLDGCVHSRIIFGYISRVFPLLEELRIWTPYKCSTRGNIQFYPPRLRFELDGGMCLMGRLRNLQRLEVRPGKGSLTTPIDEVDLNWMLRSGQGGKYRLLRRIRVESWRLRKKREKELEMLRLQKQLAQPEGNAVPLVDPELMGQLRNLGLLVDVEEMILEMDSRSYRPLPSLEGLSIKTRYFVWPESEVSLCIPEESRS